MDEWNIELLLVSSCENHRTIVSGLISQPLQWLFREQQNMGSPLEV